MYICIAGDSWGCGEWGKDSQNKYSVLHHGLEQYLRERGHNVDNFSKGGSSNNESIDTILSNNNVYDYVFWFQTDPLRDLRPYDVFKNKMSYEELVEIGNNLLDTSYSRLNKPIYCIGGCSKLNLDLMSKYANLIPLIPSIPEMLIKNFEHPAIWQSDWVRVINRQFDLKSIYKLHADKMKQDSLRDEKDLFWPDGGHANRKGHKIVCDVICDKLSL